MVAAVAILVASVVAIAQMYSQSERDHRDWVVESAIVGRSLTLDDRIVTVRRGDGSEQTLTMSVTRRAKEGDLIEVWHPPGHPEAAEQTQGFFDIRAIAIGWLGGVGGLMVFGTAAFALRRVRAFERLDRSPLRMQQAVVQTWEGGLGRNRMVWIAVYFGDLVPMDPRVVVANTPNLTICATFSAGSAAGFGVGIRQPVTGVFVARVKTSGGPNMTTLVYDERSEFVLAGRRVFGAFLPRRPTDPAEISLLEVGATGIAPVAGPPPTVVTSRADARLVMAGWLALVAFALLTPWYFASFLNFSFSPLTIVPIYALAGTAFGLPALVRFRLRSAARRAPADAPLPAQDHPEDHLRQAAGVLGWGWVPAPRRIGTALAAYQVVAILFILLTISS